MAQRGKRTSFSRTDSNIFLSGWMVGIIRAPLYFFVGVEWKVKILNIYSLTNTSFSKKKKKNCLNNNHLCQKRKLRMDNKVFPCFFSTGRELVNQEIPNIKKWESNELDVCRTKTGVEGKHFDLKIAQREEIFS